MKFSVAAAAAAALLPLPAAALSLGNAAEAAMKTARETARKALAAGVVQSLTLDQKLLVCNAYPGETPIAASLNGKDVFGSEDAKGSIAFKQCRYISSHVQKQDRLDFDIGDAEVHSTFEVGDLPSTDAVLLLVLQKREKSPMISFKSFAFPSATGREDAQLAVINTFKGSSGEPRLEMEDHLVSASTGSDKTPVARRTEQLSFNRVYSVEAGSYDATILDAAKTSADSLRQRTASRALNLAKGTNYVVLRTQEGATGESLMVFPDTPLPKSDAPRAAAGASLIAALLAGVCAMAA